MAAPGLALSNHAETLARQGRASEAVIMLRQAAVSGDADALFTLGHWRLSGQYIPRKLAESRELFRRAAMAGHAEAARILTAFLANGTGGPPAWAEALKLLEARAASDPDAAKQLGVIRKMQLSETADPLRLPSPKLLSESPHAQLIAKLFTADECRFLIATAKPLLQPAVVVHPQTGQFIRNPVRTSESAAFPLALENPAIHALNRRIAAASGTLVAQGEPLQVLRYRPGQEYKPHSDALPGEANQRVATLLVYLNDGYSGGETHFLANGLKVRGEIGDALLFRNVKPDGRPDERGAHAGLPVTRGEKLIASRWIRARPLQLEPA